MDASTALPLIENLFRTWFQEAAKMEMMLGLFDFSNSMAPLTHALSELKRDPRAAVIKAMPIVFNLSTRVAAALQACLPDIVAKHKGLEMMSPEAEHDANILGSVFGILSLPMSLARIVSENHLDGTGYLTDFKTDTAAASDALNGANLACVAILETWDMHPAFFEVFQTRQIAVQGTAIVSLFVAEALTCFACDNDGSHSNNKMVRMRGIQFAEMYPILLRSARAYPNFVHAIKNMLSLTLRNRNARQTMANTLKLDKISATAFSALVVKCGIKISDPLCTHLENNRSEDCKILLSHVRAGWVAENKASRIHSRGHSSNGSKPVVLSVL